MSKQYVTHTITVHHKDGTARQHHVMASDDASAIHQVPLDPAKERIVGIRRTEHANKETPQITHAVSFKTNDLFGGDGHEATHYVSVKRGSIEKEIEKMTKKNPQLGTPLGAHKIAEGTRVTYAELKVMLNEVMTAYSAGKVADREFGRAHESPPPEHTPERKTSYANAAADHAARRQHGVGAAGGHVITHPVTGRSMAFQSGSKPPVQHTASTARKESMSLAQQHNKPVTHTAFGPDGTHRHVTYHPNGHIEVKHVGG